MSENRRKKILLVTRPIAPPWDEASKNFAFELAKNIREHEIYLLTSGVIPGLPENIHQKPIYTSSRLTWLQRPRLLKLIRLRKDVDIIHFMLTPAKLNAFGFKAFIKNKNARTIQTIATLREDLYSDQEIKNLIFGDLIITYSDHAKNKLNLLGFNNVKRVYPGIDLNYYSPAPRDKDLAKNYNLKLNDFIITFPGEYTRLGATDDIANLVLSRSRVWKDKNVRFIFACRVKNSGDARKKEEIIKKLRENNCLDRVIFTDTFSDMAKLYNLSDVIIFPVRDMQGKFDVPLVVVEAMACGKPVIISDLPILQEFATAENSVKIKSGDTEQLFAAIERLRANPAERENIGRAARKLVEDNFDIKKISLIYDEIYEKL
jgi:glycosyltransferase involved in cell wall biosynthesis